MCAKLLSIQQSEGLLEKGPAVSEITSVISSLKKQVVAERCVDIKVLYN